VENLKITIVDDSGKYSAVDTGPAFKMGALSVSDPNIIQADALDAVCSSLLALFPNDLVKLRVSYDLGNHCRTPRAYP
jgi:hypothetical protein